MAILDVYVDVQRRMIVVLVGDHCCLFFLSLGTPNGSASSFPSALGTRGPSGGPSRNGHTRSVLACCH